MYNSEEVYIYHLPAAHTDGDSIVMFRRSGVVSTGDLFMPLVSYPVIDVDKGGTIDGFIKGLNQIIDLLCRRTPRRRHLRYSGTRTNLRPKRHRQLSRHGHHSSRAYRGHGRGWDDARTGESRKPTADYDGLYGNTTGPWTTDMFIEAVYRDSELVPITPIDALREPRVANEQGDFRTAQSLESHCISFVTRARRCEHRPIGRRWTPSRRGSARNRGTECPD